MKRKPVRTKTLSSAERIVRQANRLTSGETNATPPVEPGFQEVLALIEHARERAYQAVNTGLIDLYWQVGGYISRKLQAAEWGNGVDAELAACIQRRHPNLRGFTRASLFRMRQFFEAYRHDSKVAALLRQLPWTHHLTILGRGKSPEEREFYLRMAIREQWPSRQLERQFDACLFERAILSPPKVAAVLRQSHPQAADIFKDSYVVEFLQLQDGHLEDDLHRGLLAKLKQFLIELGRDFCFIGTEYPLQVGGRDCIARINLLI